MKKGKAGGPSDVVPEMVKAAAGKAGVEVIIELVIQITVKSFSSRIAT